MISSREKCLQTLQANVFCRQFVGGHFSAARVRKRWSRKSSSQWKYSGIIPMPNQLELDVPSASLAIYTGQIPKRRARGHTRPLEPHTRPQKRQRPARVDPQCHRQECARPGAGRCARRPREIGRGMVLFRQISRRGDSCDQHHQPWHPESWPTAAHAVFAPPPCGTAQGNSGHPRA
jgi:hypothetical protein